MSTPYHKALVLIGRHRGTPAAYGFAKLILSLYYPGGGYGLGDCVAGFDSDQRELVCQIVEHYLEHGPDAVLGEVAEVVRITYPNLSGEGVTIAPPHEPLTGGMSAGQLDRLDGYAERLIEDPTDSSYTVLSTGEQMYVLLAASRADRLADRGDTIPEALARLGEPDVANLVARWQYRHYSPPAIL